ncbi:conserved hypothetical protein [Coccidioides posadasii str. Silveira]|uniref:Uncharacterized protein n=2 Tax=Coccidioides posadasii TaxID=199306 RepID=E9DC09_COCPS|nr:conserved hypothetical protein [Coccidioides posadasii str. Silveira]KMM67827.1 hypothetical protein CPAG_04160 [Coccidioides posadasii RMSCC 3488]
MADSAKTVIPWAPASPRSARWPSDGADWLRAIRHHVERAPREEICAKIFSKDVRWAVCQGRVEKKGVAGNEKRRERVGDTAKRLRVPPSSPPYCFPQTKQSSLSVFRSSKDGLLCCDKSTRARFQVSRSFDEKNATSYSVLLYIGKHPYAEPYASEMAPTIHNSKKESIAISQMIGGHICLVAHTSPDDPTNCIKPAHHLEELHA